MCYYYHYYYVYNCNVRHNIIRHLYLCLFSYTLWNGSPVLLLQLLEASGAVELTNSCRTKRLYLRLYIIRTFYNNMTVDDRGRGRATVQRSIVSGGGGCEAHWDNNNNSYNKKKKIVLYRYYDSCAYYTLRIILWNARVFVFAVE